MPCIFLGPTSEPVTGQSVAFSFSLGAAREGDSVIYISTAAPGLRKYWMLVRGAAKFISEIWFRKYDAIYLTSSRSLVGVLRDSFFILYGKLVGRACVINHLHGSDFKENFEKTSLLAKKWILYVYKHVDISIVLHEAMAGEYAMCKKMTVEVIENCIADSLRSIAQVRKEKVPEKAPGCRILFLSNIIEEKGVAELIEAACIMNAKGLHFKIDIAGKEIGETLAEIVRRRFGPSFTLPTNVRVLGACYGAEKARLLYDADIFVLPSYYASEAVPIAALEAMFFGCALVLSDWRYLAAVFGAFGVRFVKPRSALELASVLENLITDEGSVRMLGKKNAAIVENRFLECEFVSQLRCLLDRSTAK